MRAPIWLASTSTWSLVERSSVVDSGSARCTTPTVRPMMDTGTHMAAQRPYGRSRRCEHASRFSLSSNVCVCPRRAATQRSGDSTVQPGPSAFGPMTKLRCKCAWLLSASSTSTLASGSRSRSARPTEESTSASSSAISSALAKRVSNSRRCASSVISRSRAKLSAS